MPNAQRMSMYSRLITGVLLSRVSSCLPGEDEGLPRISHPVKVTLQRLSYSIHLAAVQVEQPSTRLPPPLLFGAVRLLCGERVLELGADRR